MPCSHKGVAGSGGAARRRLQMSMVGPCGTSRRPVRAPGEVERRTHHRSSAARHQRCQRTGPRLHHATRHPSAPTYGPRNHAESLQSRVPPRMSHIEAQGIDRSVDMRLVFAQAILRKPPAGNPLSTPADQRSLQLIWVLKIRASWARTKTPGAVQTYTVRLKAQAARDQPMLFITPANSASRVRCQRASATHRPQGAKTNRAHGRDSTARRRRRQSSCPQHKLQGRPQRGSFRGLRRPRGPSSGSTPLRRCDRSSQRAEKG